MSGQGHSTADLHTGKRHGIHLAGAEGARRLVRTGTENLAPTCIQSSDRPSRSKSLYRLRNPGPTVTITT